MGLAPLEEFKTKSNDLEVNMMSLFRLLKSNYKVSKTQTFIKNLISRTSKHKVTETTGQKLHLIPSRG